MPGVYLRQILWVGDKSGPYEKMGMPKTTLIPIELYCL